MLQFPELLNHLRQRFQLVDRGQLVRQGREPEFLDRRFVHKTPVEIADFLLVGSVRVSTSSRFVDNLAQIQQGLVHQDDERTVIRFVIGNRCVFEPLAVDMQE